MFLKRSSFGIKENIKELKMLSKLVFCTKLASFGHLGLITDPLMVSKFHNGMHGSKGQENKIYNSEGQGKALLLPHSPNHQL